MSHPQCVALSFYIMSLGSGGTLKSLEYKVSTVPNRRSRILEVVICSEAVDNLGSGNSEGGGIRERVEKGEVSLQAT